MGIFDVRTFWIRTFSRVLRNHLCWNFVGRKKSRQNFFSAFPSLPAFLNCSMALSSLSPITHSLAISFLSPLLTLWHSLVSLFLSPLPLFSRLSLCFSLICLSPLNYTFSLSSLYVFYTLSFSLLFLSTLTSILITKCILQTRWKTRPLTIFIFFQSLMNKQNFLEPS